jgi:hypothetical protein
VLLLLSAAACSPGQQSQVPSPSVNSVAVLPCEDAIGSNPTPLAGKSTVFDRVALPTGRALQASPDPSAESVARLFAKDGLQIRRSVVFDLVVPDEWVGRLLIGWGSPAKRTTHLHVPGCQPKETLNPLRPTDDWIAYAGGYWVKDPACVDLSVQVGNAQQSVRIGVGAACPGQAAPPTP